MMMTTILLSYFLYRVKKWNFFLVGAVATLFILIEGSFFIANLKKFPEFCDNYYFWRVLFGDVCLVFC
jgi:KUP system potassium uptake protein